jgi:U3 small nucleolar ribonucleoprotein component
MARASSIKFMKSHLARFSITDRRVSNIGRIIPEQIQEVDECISEDISPEEPLLEKQETNHLDQILANNYEKNNMFFHLNSDINKLPGDDSDNDSEGYSGDHGNARRDTDLFRNALENTLE